MTQGENVTPHFAGRRILNANFAIGAGDLPLLNPSYSMQGEDLIVRSLLKAELRSGKRGFYADLGAHKPCYGNNTYLFYQYGWRGLCVEPNPGFADAYQQTRPGDTFISAAIGPDGKGFWAESTANSALSRVAAKQDDFGPDFKQPVEVPFVSLATLFSTFAPRGAAIDYMSLDVEGVELAALQSNDWSRFRPKVIVIEENQLRPTDPLATPALRYLHDLGYEVAGILPPNVVMIAR